MSWYPPWSLRQRQVWVIQRPYLAGIYYGLELGILVGILVAVASHGGILGPLLTASFIWIVAALWIGIAIRARWGVRNHPAWRPLSWASDRELAWFMWLTGLWLVTFVILAATDDVGIGDKALRIVPPVFLSVWMVLRLRLERRRRRREQLRASPERQPA